MIAPNSSCRSTLSVLLIATLVMPGCKSKDCIEYDPHVQYPPFVQQVEYPATPVSCEESPQIFDSTPPPTVRSVGEPEKWPLTLDEAIQIALENSQVIRDVGGTIVAAPAAASTVYDPAIQEADPRLGVEAALSAFDAQLRGQLLAEQSDQAFNNVFAASSGTLRNLGAFLLNISKTGATGTTYSLQNTTDYSRIHNFMPGF